MNTDSQLADDEQQGDAESQDDGQVVALSHRQAMIRAGQLLDPDVPLYNMAHAFTIDADIDIDAFQEAFRLLVANCDALRTVIEDRDGKSLQRVLPSIPSQPIPSQSVPSEMAVLDFRSEDDPTAAATRWTEERSLRRFDLRQPMFDTALLQTGEQQYVWYLNQHHLITDAWSVSLLLRTQGQYYRRVIDGTVDQIEAPPSFQKFVVAEAANGGTKSAIRAADHWAERLTESNQPLNFYRTRPARLGSETVRIEATIEGERADKLKAFLAGPEIAAMTPELAALQFFHTVLFAYLHRVCGVDNLVVGTPFHNRAKRAAKQTVGLFMNLFPVSVTVENETMAQLAAKIGAETFESMQHAGHPPDPSQEKGAFEVVLNYLHIPFETFDDIEVTDRWIHPGAGDHGHSLRLQVRRNGDDGYRLFFDVKTALFDEEAQQSLIRHFLMIADQWLDDANVEVQTLSLLTDEETDRLVHEFNGAGQAPSPTHRLATGSVVDQIESMAERHRDSVAIDGPETVTYQELNQRANHLAYELIERGIGVGDVVGLMLGRNADAVISMLAILKSGAAFLPIEPGVPPTRLSRVLADTKASVVCTDQEGISAVTASGAAPLLVSSTSEPLAIDSERNISLAEMAEPTERQRQNPKRHHSPEETAYVIFTSGSTGRPKGVPITHGAFGNYVDWARGHYTNDERRSFPLFTSLAFDLTITSIFVPLTSGGTIVTFSDDDADGTPTVVDVWKDDRVDVVKLTPSHLAIVRQLGLKADRLKVLIVGGEDFPSDLASAIQVDHPEAAIYNEYGPTETTVGCMIHRYSPSTDRLPSVPIGEPGANAEIYLLDRHGQPVPPGVIGEIHIGGPGLSNGYLEQPDVTAERFINRPPTLNSHLRSSEGSSRRSDRLYRSGDLGRWQMVDGPPQLEFLGRVDGQVKLRGHRIELGEIEAALASQPTIELAAAVVSETSGAAAVDPSTVFHCRRCGLPSNFPDATFDDDLCSLCQDYDSYRTKVDEYFKDLNELRTVAASIKGEANRNRQAGQTSQYDCLVLLSGGKDSTYMLYQVVALGLNPLVFTLDNGYISPSALANCRRVCQHLGVDLEVGSTEHMNEIFRDSLDRFANVCNGCFKTIYTLSMNLAKANGIGYIVTGLARGQLFETRLSDMYNHRIFDVDQIDEYVLEARKAYHHIDDAVSQLLDVEAFADDRIFDEVQFVDFYRYADVALDEVLRFLTEETPWSRPPDTGRSTNCLINDVGIHIHNHERGFHNYALPYSWDVRLGHKERDAAMDELDDDIDLDFVNEVLVEIGYKPKPAPSPRRTSRLIAHYQAPVPVDENEVRAALADSLPDYMVPTTFVHHTSLPLTQNGKIDRASLPDPESTGSSGSSGTKIVEELSTDQERAATILATIWAEIFEQPVSLSDNFFYLGGDSIIAIQIVDRAASAGLGVTPRNLFEAETLAASAVASVWLDDEQQADAPSTTLPTEIIQPTDSIVGSSNSGPIPLTPTQHGMLFHSLAEPESGLYEGQIVHTMRGQVDPALLEQSWQRLVERHDVMRTVFRWERLDKTDQRVADVAPDIVVEDWTNASSKDRFQHQLNQFLADDRATGFDLRAQPAVRLALLQSPVTTVIVWTFHHIAFDGWSIALAMNELLDDYQAHLESRQWVAPDRRGFGSYLDWLQSRDQGAVETFWRREMAGFNSLTALPRSETIPPGDAASSRNSASVENPGRPYAAVQRGLADDAAKQLAPYASSEQVTMSTIIQAAWGIVLSRYEGSDDVVFGVTTSGRPATLPGAETIIGMLVTTLPARLRIAPDLEPGVWLRELQTTQLGVREHEYAALTDVQQWSDLGSGQPLFESILVIENFPDYQPPADPAALAVEARAYRVQTNYPLAIIVLPGEELTLKAVYDPGQFTEARINEILDHMEAAITSIVSGEATTVSGLSIIGPVEEQALLRWATGDPSTLPSPSASSNGPSSTELSAAGLHSKLPDAKLVPDMIRRRAEEHGDEIAVVCAGQSLTYAELLAASTDLAEQLRLSGVSSNDYVGVMVERSIEMVVAIIAVHGAGAAYVPLDPSYPAERLRFMLADAEVRLVVVSDELADNAVASDLVPTIITAPGSTSLHIRSTNPPGERSSSESDTKSSGDSSSGEQTADGNRRWNAVSADDPAYLIYTSGSTGQPNGVSINHGNLAFSTGARFTNYRHSPQSFLLLSSFSFDSSIAGIFWTLSAGGCIVLPKPSEELDVRKLTELIKTHSVSHTLALPSLYQLLLDAADPDDLSSLQTVIVAGEACSREVVLAHHRSVPEAELHNEYGPTEASVWCTSHRCDADQVGSVPIGVPIPGATVAVLDTSGRPAGIGVPGELFVSGPGLASGYYNRPALTAERFVELDGTRWFATRDRAIVQPGGLIEFGGRVDDLVKIRGVRVQLGEVETAVTAHPSVAMAAAVMSDGAGGTSSKLVAIVELHEGAEAPSVSELRTTVGTRLPDAFVPSQVLTVEHIPRLPNGKVDRSRLPTPKVPDAKTSSRAPDTEQERIVADIWSNLLPDTSFGVEDDFFDIGGHSLLAVGLVEAIRRETGTDLPLASLLETPTIAALARAISNSIEGTNTSDTGSPTNSRCLVPLRKTGTKPPIYLIPPAAGTALSFREFVANADPDQPLYCFEPLGNDGRDEPHDTVEAMAKYYIDELRQAQPNGNYRIGGSCLGAIVAWEMASQLTAAGSPVELLVFLDPGPPHSGPGWSYTLPSQRSPMEVLRSTADIVFKGELLTAAKAVWRRNRFDRIGRIHYRAQLSYVADRLEAPIIWLESSELAANRPDFLKQWRILAGEDLTPIVVDNTTHDGLMVGQADEVARMAALFNVAIAQFDSKKNST